MIDVEKMDADEIVCNCMGVTKEDIMNVINDGAKTFEDVQEETGVVTGCSTCESKSKAVVEYYLNQK